MTTTIGRCSFDNTYSFLSWDGDALSLGIDILPATLEEAKVMRQQMTGLMNNRDESAFPVTSTDDPDLDGFYIPVAAQIEPVQAYLTNNLMRCSFGLRRVANGYARPSIEVTFIMSEITNPYGVTERGRFAVPNTGLELRVSAATLANPQYITTATGKSVALLTNSGASPINPGPVSGTMSYMVPPADFYNGAATIELEIGGTWYPVVGEQIPAGWTNWRLNNDWVRISPSVSSGAYYMLFEAWDGAAWTTVGTFARAHYDTGVWTTDKFATSNPRGVTTPGAQALAFPIVMRNGPEIATVKIPQLRGHETWSLARGDAFVRGYYIDDSNADNNAVQTSTTIAVTDSTSHMVRTTASSGFKFFVSTPVANTVDTTNGRIRTDVIGDSLNFAIGYSTPAHSTGISEDLFTLAVTTQKQRVSAR